MFIKQTTINGPFTSQQNLDGLRQIAPQLVMAFGSVNHFREGSFYTALKTAFPNAHLMGCTTAGEISNDGVADDTLVLTAIHFAKPGLCIATTNITDMADSEAAGARLASQLIQPGLHNVIVLGQGVNINGSALIAGFRSKLPEDVVLSGGLAGDGGAFSQSYTLSDNGISDQQIVALGFTSSHSKLSHGSFGGWQPFGPARKVTRAEGNILFELDGEPALDIYKRYLGDYAKDLPGSGLLFPFEMLGEDHSAIGLIRTILGIDENNNSLILAGDIIQNGYLRLMHASTDALVDGAQAAAEQTDRNPDHQSLALLVSCIGRKLVMGGRVDEEVEAVADVLGKQAQVTGFYSNGEISPLFEGTECKLHNQTMTITHITET